MAITTSTIFDRVRIDCNCDTMYVDTIIPYDGTSSAEGREAIRPGTTDVDQLAQLTIMKDRVIAGTATVWYYDRGWISYADLPMQHALIHAMHQMHPNDGWKVPVQMLLNGDFSQDSDSGEPQVALRGRFKTPPFKPTGPTLTFPLSDFEPVPSVQNPNRFLIRLDIRPERMVTSDNIDNMPEIRALSAWMGTLDTQVGEEPLSSPAWPTSGFVTSANWVGRKAYFPQGDIDGGDMLITVTGILVFSVTHDGENVYSSFGLIFSTETGVVYNIQGLGNQLGHAEQSISTTGIELDGSLGDVRYPARCSFIDMGEGRSHRFDLGAPLTVVTDDGASALHRIYLGNRRVLMLDDLDLFGGKYVLPIPRKNPLAGEVHINGLTSDIIVRAQIPPLMVGKVNNLRPFIIHNRDSTFNVTLEDWDNDNVITLKPGRHIDLSFSYRRDGTGGMIGDTMPRRHTMNAGQQGTADAVTSFTLGADHIRPLPTPAIGDHFIDTDSFEIGTETWPLTGHEFTSANVVFAPYFVKTIKAGQLYFRQAMDIVLNTNTGSLMSGWGLRLYRLRGTELELLDPAPRDPLVGQDDSRQAACLFEGETEVDDIYMPMFFYPNGSVNLSNVRVDSIHREMHLVLAISKEFTP